MPLEWSVAGLLLAAAMWPLVRRTRSWGARAGVLFLLVAAIAGGFVWQSRATSRLTARNQLLQKLPAENHPGGYVRSETCRSCHPDQYTSWHGSFHRTMTQRATPESVRGNFTNVTLKLGDETFHLSRRGDEFFADMVDPDWKYVRALQQQDFVRGRGPAPKAEPNPPRVEKRITLTTGSHHMQAYWVAGDFGNQQFSVPFTYLFEESRWVPRNDVFMLPPGSPALQQVWNNNCLGCHATAGQPKQDQRTFVLNTRVAEYGIACESCHGPAEEHVRANSNPRRRYALHRGTNLDSTITNPARISTKKSSEICGQCHAARFNVNHGEWLMEGFDYWHRKDISRARPLMPGKELEKLNDLSDPQQAAKHRSLSSYFWSDGMIRVSGREYSGLVETPCFQRGNMSCLSCHSMHKMSSPDDQLARGMEGNQACYQCHGDYAKKLAQHTHHAANSSGSLCYNCHMPHTTYGLLKGIRSHQLTSPTVKSSLDTGRPNACNLCHLDQTLAWTAKNLNTWYRQPVPSIEPELAKTPASVAWLLRGDAGQRALIAWHMGWEPAKQASGTNWLVPYLAETLDDPYSVVRYIGQRSLKHVPGFEKFAYDYIAPAEQRVRAKSEALQQWDPQQLRAGDSAKVLLPQQISKLLQQRDHRPMELLE
jgi:predicted CXXCH cytochrome family protein